MSHLRLDCRQGSVPRYLLSTKPKPASSASGLDLFCFISTSPSSRVLISQPQEWEPFPADLVSLTTRDKQDVALLIGNAELHPLPWVSFIGFLLVREIWPKQLCLSKQFSLHMLRVKKKKKSINQRNRSQEYKKEQELEGKKLTPHWAQNFDTLHALSLSLGSISCWNFGSLWQLIDRSLPENTNKYFHEEPRGGQGNGLNTVFNISQLYPWPTYPHRLISQC